jgi:uncharacterized protein
LVDIAIVGSGIAGLTAGYLLSHAHRVTLYEADMRIGGHTSTDSIELDGITHDIDTGFIVFNNRNYPNFVRLLDELRVTSQATEMSFSVSAGDEFEYAGSNLDTLFAQRRNLLRPAFWRMLRDILRFNREAVRDIDAGTIPDNVTLGDYLDHGGYSSEFRDWYLIPMGAAIWSCGTQTMREFPLPLFIRFFRNHGLLSLNDRPQWRTVCGGSRTYLGPLAAPLLSTARLGDPVSRVIRNANQVVLVTRSEHVQHHDQVILGCHSDQALALIDSPHNAEREILGAIAYRENDVVLHTDTRLLPRRAAAWASWNYRISGNDAQLPTLTYNMNILQRLQSPHTFCVSLNDTAAIDPARILRRHRYSHPVFTAAGLRAQQRWTEINGVHRTWYCGSWWGNGFHEDGVVSAVRVARALGVSW